MNALERIHAALVEDGILIDTQPVSARPLVASDDGELGALDMRDWAATVAAVDRRVEQVIEDGLFTLESERLLVVTDAYADGPELLAEVDGWAGTRVDPALAERAQACASPLRLHQDVRLRVLRAL